MILRSISPQAAAILIAFTLVGATAIELGAYYSGVRAETRFSQRRKLGRNYCFSCHSDKHTIAMMEAKEDRSGAGNLPGGIFDPDGTGHSAAPPTK